MASTSLTRIGSLTTTDATALQEILSIPIPDQVQFVAQVIAQGATSTGSKYIVKEMIYSGYRDAGGNVTVTGGILTPTSSNNDAALALSCGGSASNFLVVCTGLLGTTIYWVCRVDLTYVSTL
jgi:hypothetical protein